MLIRVSADPEVTGLVRTHRQLAWPAELWGQPCLGLAGPAQAQRSNRHGEDEDNAQLDAGTGKSEM